MKVFPNPFTETGQVQFTEATQGLVKIRVFSLDGALLKTFLTRLGETIRLNLSRLAQGLYILQIVGSERQYATKIQKR